ncbi:MAG: aspartate kinase [Clostridiales bacterium]|nr:aspartate kinase [Clostridiales bacterium]MDN5298174.1 aspartate kinase [Clostridiales bacterium]
MDIVIQKYGGTSVATDAGRRVIAENAKHCLEHDEVPVVVVSAMGRKGAPYATDSLIEMYRAIYDEEASPDLDLLMSCGEVMSAALIANTLRSEGMSSRAVSGAQLGIITDNQYGSAKVIRTDATKLLRAVNDYDVLVLTGFQGVSESGCVTTLGRGGSDATAVIVGEMLKAVRVEIYTDVDGVMTADPRYVSGAKVLDQISYEEVYQMALDGARVIDSKAIAVAKRAKMELWVKNTFSKSPGTRIFVDADRSQPSMVTAIAHLNGIAQFRISHQGDELAFDRLLDRLADNGISIDLINFLPNEKFFTVPMQYVKIITAIAAEGGMMYTIVEDCSKITIIGPGIHGVPGVMRRVVKALHSAGVEILQTSDSYTTIACLIEQKHLQKALPVLHETFDLSL